MAYSRKTVATGRKTLITGGQVNDANHVALQGIASGFQTVDGNASPVVSPITASASNTVITVPQNAVSIIITAVTACTVSEDVNFASSLALTLGATVTLNVARQSLLYIRGSGSVSFAFLMVD